MRFSTFYGGRPFHLSVKEEKRWGEYDWKKKHSCKQKEFWERKKMSAEEENIPRW
jgi:hypothetical protein